MKQKRRSNDMKHFSVVFMIAAFFLLGGCQRSRQEYVKEGTVSLNDVELYYKIIGEGEPVVILHGGPGFDHIHMLPLSELANERSPCEVLVGKPVLGPTRCTSHTTNGTSAKYASPRNSAIRDNPGPDVEVIERNPAHPAPIHIPIDANSSSA